LKFNTFSQGNECKGFDCGVRGCILGTNRKPYAQKGARALFCGIWTCDAKVTDFLK